MHIRVSQSPSFIRKDNSDACIALWTRRSFSLRQKTWTVRVLLQVEWSHSRVSGSKRLASDSTSLENLLTLFPDLRKELDLACKDALGKVAKPSFQHSKERVFIAEAFFNQKPDLAENDRKELLALIKDAGDPKVLKTRLKGWENSTGGPSSWFSAFKSIFFSKEETSKAVDDAAHRSKDTKDREFLAALQGKVTKEPLLEQLIQDVKMEAHTYFREFMKQRLPKLFSRAHDIQRQIMYRQVELGVNEEDKKRRDSLRNDWFNEIKMSQAQVNPGCVFCCPVYLPLLNVCFRSQPMVLIHGVEEVKQRWSYSNGKSPGSFVLITYTLLPTAFKFTAEVTQHTPAFLEYKVHNLSLTSDSRQALQLDPHSIPSIRVQPRHSYQFRLHANWTIL